MLEDLRPKKKPRIEGGRAFCSPDCPQASRKVGGEPELVVLLSKFYGDHAAMLNALPGSVFCALYWMPTYLIYHDMVVVRECPQREAPRWSQYSAILRGEVKGDHHAESPATVET